MPLPSIVFDVGAISNIGTTQATRAETTVSTGAQFVQARRVNEPKRDWRLSWGNVPMETVEAILDLWRRTHGGTGRMSFVSPDQEGIFVVRFAGQDGLVWSQRTARTASIAVRLEEV